MKIKLILLSLLQIFIFSELFCQSTTKGLDIKIIDEDPNWDNPSNWNGNIGSSPITISKSDSILKLGNLTFAANGELNIQEDAYLKINGELSAAASVVINVQVGGDLIITGDIKVAADGQIEINGELQAAGFKGPKKSKVLGSGTIYIPGSKGETPDDLDWSGFDGAIVDGYLPVEMLSFTAHSKSAGNTLQWSTATETNNMGFEIQRMHYSHQQWEVIGWVDGHYNYNGILNYEYQDKAPLKGINYYRLRQVDYDGAYEYHGPVAVLYEPETKAKDFTVHRDATSLHIAMEGHDQCLVEVYDLRGRQLVSQQAVYRASVPAPPKPVIVRVTYSSGHVASRIVR